MASETGEKRTQPWHFDIYEEDDGDMPALHSSLSKLLKAEQRVL